MKINDEIRLGIAEIAERFGLSLVVLFGSVAAGADRPDSDIDIGVQFKDGDPGLSRTLDVQAELSNLFRERDVDLSILNRADPFFMKKIAERCEFVYEEPGKASAFLLLAFKRYQDHRKYLGMERDYAAGYVKRIAS
jgi:predicted nucleotidyltransferase